MTFNSDNLPPHLKDIVERIKEEFYDLRSHEKPHFLIAIMEQNANQLMELIPKLPSGAEKMMLHIQTIQDTVEEMRREFGDARPKQ